MQIKVLGQSMQLLHRLPHDVLKANILVTDSLQQQQQAQNQGARSQSLVVAVATCGMLPHTGRC